MKDAIDLILMAYKAHVKNNYSRRDELLRVSTKTDTAVIQFIQFFEHISSVETNTPQSEKNRMVEQVLREKYKL
tara:strand:+ start:458 stop:679 length:222 start_codon:yes stop_codon:yes gene_type:complete